MGRKPIPKKIQKGDGWELRFDESAKGEHEQLDELVMQDAKHVHLESMGSSWCLIVEARDGTRINLSLFGRVNAAKGFVFEIDPPPVAARRKRDIEKHVSRPRVVSVPNTTLDGELGECDLTGCGEPAEGQGHPILGPGSPVPNLCRKHLDEEKKK